MAEPVAKRGTGWIAFAGTMLVIGGGIMFINGLWALRATNAVAATFRGQLLFSDHNLDTWGWIYIILGVLVLVAGVCVYMRMEWARMVGIAAAVIQVFFTFFWIFTPYWAAAIATILVDVLIIYALTSYGDASYG